MTEQQATADTLENTLAFELWEMLAPKVNREMSVLSAAEEDTSAIEKLD